MRRTPSVTHVSGTLIKADFGRVWALPCSRESSPLLPLLLDGTACLFVFSVAFGVRVEASDGKQNSRWDGYLLMSRLLIWSSVSHHAFILFCCTKMVDVLCACSTGCEMSWCSLLLELLESLGVKTEGCVSVKAVWCVCMLQLPAIQQHVTYQQLDAWWIIYM